MRDAQTLAMEAMAGRQEQLDRKGLETEPNLRSPLPVIPRNILVQDILEALPEAVYTTDENGRITFYNGAAAKLWGRHPELGSSEFCGSWKLYWPDGSLLPHDQCPMAIALRERRPVRGMEAVAERPDGSRIPFLAFPTPLFDAEGNLIGAVNMLVDLTARAIADEAAQRYAAIVEFSDDAILAKDLNGTIINWNRGAERLFGYTAEEAIGKPVMMLIPVERHDEEPEILSRIRRGERIDHYETVRRRKDGSLIEISLSVSPITTRDGRIIGASKIARDITERRRAEQQQHLLIREMDHRVKNLFTLAGSVVKLSARSASTPAELATAVSARLNALAQAHALTIPRTSEANSRIEQATTLHTLLRTILAPYDAGSGEHGSRAAIRGPDIALSGAAVTSFALCCMSSRPTPPNMGRCRPSKAAWTSSARRMMTSSPLPGSKAAGQPWSSRAMATVSALFSQGPPSRGSLAARSFATGGRRDCPSA